MNIDVLPPKVRSLYEEHGHTLASAEVSLLPMAKRLGVSVNTLRQAATYARLVGPPQTKPPPKEPVKAPKAVHLIVPDAHAAPGESYKRFDLLGKAVKREAEKALERGLPFRLMLLGDWGEFGSICSFDKGRSDFDSRRLKDDIEVCQKALRVVRHRVPGAIWESISKEALIGNHENRLHRLLTTEARTTAGFVPSPESLFTAEGFTTHPFLVPAMVDGVAYQHYFTSGVMNRACVDAKAQLLKTMVSTVAGHSHLWSYHSATSVSGAKIHALQAGVWYDADMEYAGPANKLWWRGLTVLHGVANGDIEDIEQLSMARLRRELD